MIYICKGEEEREFLVKFRFLRMGFIEKNYVCKNGTKERGVNIVNEW